jgi:hypothetical protein
METRCTFARFTVPCSGPWNEACEAPCGVEDNRSAKMEEVESLGGPLICIESRLAHQWRGIDGLSINPGASTVGIATDYERTFKSLGKYLDVLTLAHGAALILADRPMITGVWKDASGRAIIWRISFAEEDDDIPAMLASLTEKSFETSLETVEFSFGSPNVVIFDSSCPGNEAQSESVSFDMAPGRYRVTTHEVRPAPNAELVLHRFTSVA